MKNLKYTVGGLLIIILGMGMAYAGDGQIDIAVLPYTISKPGSYIVTRDLTLTTLDTSGITITTGSVTLDLNGHALRGPGKTAGVGGCGIILSGPMSDLIIRNGIVCEWRADGVNVANADNSQVENICSHSNGLSGIEAGYGSKVTGNTCLSNGNNGIWSGVSNIIGNTCRLNGNTGIAVSAASTIINNTCTYNGGFGIAGLYGSTITNNTCQGNTYEGIISSSSTIIGNTVRNGGSTGIYSDSNSLIRENICEGNHSSGIRVGSSCRVVENVCAGNGPATYDGAGIEAINSRNSIEHNLVNNNDRGIDCNPATGNYIASNRASGNTTDYDIVAGNVWGAIVNMTGGGLIATTDPYANFQF